MTHSIYKKLHAAKTYLKFIKFKNNFLINTAASATLPAMVEEATSQGLKQDDESCAILAALQNFAFYGGLWLVIIVTNK